MRVKFQADANLDERIVRGLHRREPAADFRTAHAARLKGLFFTDDHLREVISIGDELKPKQRTAVLDHALNRTQLQPEKRKREVLMFNYMS